MQYAGVSLRMEPGQKEQYEINCARHLLNNFGARGLTSLIYGATVEQEKQIGLDAVDRNLEFKKKQVIEYNQRNEARMQMKLSYLPPTGHVKKYAIELGLKLLEPYAVRDEERSDIADTKRENKQLREEMAELRQLVQQMLKGKTEPIATEEREEPGDFYCQECGKNFKNHIALGSHKRSHGG